MKKMLKVLLIFVILISNFGCGSKKNKRILYSWHMKTINDTDLIRVIKELNIDTLYQDFSTDYLNSTNNIFIKQMNSYNVKVYHLAGDPSWGIKGKDKIKEEINKVIKYNRKNKYKIDGIVLDIESYILDSFDGKDYLKILKESYKYAKKNEIYVVLCIPTWFDKYGKSYLKDLIINTNDEVSFMNYNIKNTIKDINGEMKFIKKYGKKANTIYEVDFNNKNYFSSYDEINNDYKKVIKYYRYPISLAFHHYDSIK